jgi:glycosyltransferase involved in cell wall biosynthesis
LHGLASRLAESHPVSVLSFAPPAGEGSSAIEAARVFCEEIVTVPNLEIGRRGAPKRASQLRSLISARSYERQVFEQEPLQAALGRMMDRSSYDVLQIESCFMAHYVFPREPVLVLDEHNVEYEIARRTVSVTPGLPRKLYTYVNYLKMRSDEERAWRTLDACAVTSARDEATIRQAFASARTAVVPNGVDADFFSPIHRRPEPFTLIFFGTMSYYPNADAALYFLREVMPLLRPSYPSLRLLIVGYSPPAAVRRLAGPDVIVTDFVDDVRPYLARASAVVVPLRIGGGTRLKVLEAMAMAKPVISTTLGVEGIAVTNERDVLTGDGAQALATQIRRVLDDEDYGNSLGSAARRLVEGDYEWSASARKLETLYRSTLATRSDARSMRVPLRSADDSPPAPPGAGAPKRSSGWGSPATSDEVQEATR